MSAAVTIAHSVRNGVSRAMDHARVALDAIDARDGALNCFTNILRETALADAATIDAKIARGEDAGPLAGVPFAVKNLFDVAGVTTLAGSKILRDQPPAVRDATAVQRLRAAGAVLVGTLNMDEFAYGFVTENAHDGPTRNPHAPDRVAGGSSGGSAAAVAAGMVPISLGSDTNGSIRVPASLCGIYGLKPTYGRLSRHGAYPFVPDLDHIGPFARNVRDLAAVYDVLQGPDARDPACTARPAAPSLSELDAPAPALRVGVLGGWFAQGGSDAAQAAVEAVARAFDSVRSVTLPGAEAARSAAFCLTAAQAGELHRKNLQDRPLDFDPATRDRLLAGLLLPASALASVRRVRRKFLDEVRAAFEDFDILLAPATPFSAPRIGQATEHVDGVDVPVRANLGLYTQPISFVGLPVVTVPTLDASPLPLGVQIIGPAWHEPLLLQIAHDLERRGVVGAWGSSGAC